MKKRAKIILITIGILFLILGGGFITLVFIKKAHEAKPFSLDNAPQEIKDLKTKLKTKLDANTFSWNDMPDFVIFSQYVVDHSPDVLKTITDWDAVVWHNVTDKGGYYFISKGGHLTIELGYNSSLVYNAAIIFDFNTMVSILKMQESGQHAVQVGKLHFEGKLTDVMKVNFIDQVISVTIYGNKVDEVKIDNHFQFTANNESEYIEDGLTVIPYISVNILPDRIGEAHVATPIKGGVLIINTRGQILYRFDGIAATVAEMLNSSTVILGGQSGNMVLWNFKKGITQQLNFPAGNHDLDYNPKTKTIMLINPIYSNETFNGLPIIYDQLLEYTLDGKLVWKWDGQKYYPFNITEYESFGNNRTFLGGVDWTHANAFAWDKSEQAIYLNFKNINKIIKIDYKTKQILWQAGWSTNFTCYNLKGEKVDSLYHQGHGLEKIGKNRFIVFDNDLFNSSNPNTMHLEHSQGYSRFLEFVIDPENKTMRSVWDWVPSNSSYYLPQAVGDADRLPDGNTIGLFDDRALILNEKEPAIITEVTKNGDKAWELTINGQNNTYFWIQQVERFYTHPIVKVNQQYLNLSRGILNLNLSTWNSYKIDSTVPGKVQIVIDDHIFYEKSFNFSVNWERKDLNISLTNIDPNAKSIKLIISNADGDTYTYYILGHAPKKATGYIAITAAIITFCLLIVGTYIILRKKGKIKIKRHQS